MPKIIKPTLYYVYDPMCSWCWGYRPTWLKLQQQLSDKVEIAYCVGGLAPDSDAPMANDMRRFLQQTWHKISNQLGTEFNFDFWRHSEPRRSTYPACRAVIIARQFNLEQEMLFAIQQAYYLHAKNPSNNTTLIQLAEQLSLDKKEFKQALESESTQNALMTEIAKARALPIQGVPSLVLSFAGQNIPINIDYQNWQTSYKQVVTLLSD